MFDLKFDLRPDLSFFAKTKTERRELLELIKRSTCYFQQHFIDYSIVASNKHKCLRICLAKEPDNLSQLKTVADDLVGHCNHRLDAAFHRAAEFLHDYFEFGNRIKNCRPRICVKISPQDDKVIDLFRDRGGGTKVPYEYPTKENSGFDRVNKDGRHFLCNNIPQEAKEERYINPRLARKRVATYNPPTKLERVKNRFSDNQCTDKRWEECWDLNKKTPANPESCYKSTLIVPMTLIDADISAELRKILHIEESYEKTTYGYLCFDHRETKFFRDPEDVFVGYYFAGILSLYLINRLNYIHNSDTFKEVNEKLGSSRFRVGA